MNGHKNFFVVLASFFLLFLSATAGYSYTIDASAGPGGSISPSGAVTVNPGADQNFIITPDLDYGVLDILVDTVSEGPALSYDFFSVASDHVIEASFSPCDYLFPVLLQETDTLYGTITEAYDDASITLGLTDFTLMLMANVFFDENVFFDQNVSVFLAGGYDCSFLDNSLTTAIGGTLTISAGTVIPSNIVLSSTPCIPTGSEICDGLDNDCNGLIDDGLGTDADGDGYTSIGSSCGSADDCNDSNPNINPGKPEICDGLDNNCDGQIDEGLSAVDNDGDGYSAVGSCGGTADDCNDNNINIHPGAADIPYDGIDQDCDGADLTFPGETCVGCHAPETSWNSIHDLTTPPDGTCITCHAAQVYNVLSGHYGKTVMTDGNNMTAGETIVCVSCHDPDAANHSGGIALGNGSNFVGSKISSDYPNITCDTCHENRAALHSSAHSVQVGPNDLSYDPPGILCSACHVVADWTEIEGVEHNVPTNGADSCSTCHNSPRAEVQITISAGTPPIHCLDCHSDKDLTVHGSHDATVFAWTASCGTASCHDSGTNINISTMHNGCTTCHATSAGGLGTTVEGSASYGIDGDARLGAGAGYASSTCLTCHPAATYSWEAIHTVTQTPVDHSVSVTGPVPPNTISENCLTSGCHVATSSPYEGAGEVHAAGVYAAGGCATCHTPGTGALINGTVGDATGTTGECASCHSAYFNGHLQHNDTTHAVSMGTDQSNGQSCNTSGCHGTFTDVWGVANGIYALHNNVCTTCHDSARSDADGNVQAEIQEGAATCLECHASKINEHGSHPADAFTWDSNCADCHGAGAGAELVVADIHNNNCTVCHDGPANRDNERLGAASFGVDGDATQADGTALAAESDINAWNTPTCTTCHPAATYSWEAVHTVTQTPVDHSATVTNADTTCSGCHDAVAGGTAPDAINTPFVASGEVHNNSDGQYSGTCANCHTSDGGMQAAPIRAPLLSATGGNCSACHDVYFDNHTHSHATSVTGPVPPNTISENCLTSGCHVATSSPYEGAGEVHAAGVYAAGGCATCHTPGTGALINGTVGDATGTTGECASCHSAYFNGHLQHNDTTHAVSMGTDQSNGQSCNTSGCHGTFTDVWGVANGIYALHNNVCTTCHDSARSDADGNVQAEIQEGAATCLECHASKINEHGSHPADAFTWDSNCADCHGAGAGAELVVADIHNNNCTVCHDGPANRDNERLGAASFGVDGDATQADGTALAAESDINAWNTPTCTTCHPAATYSWEAIHTVTQTPVDHTTLVRVALTGCADCHSDPPPLVDAGDATNHDGCSSCHNGDGSLTSSAVGKDFATGGDCMTCHADFHTVFPEPYTQCADCHLNEHIGWKQGPDESMHQLHLVRGDIACNDCHGLNSGGCRECHYGQHDGFYPGDNDYHDMHTDNSNITCTDCHITVPGASHTSSGYVTVGGTQDYYGTTCASCHDPGAGDNATVDVTHNGDCSNCHTTVPNLQPGVPAGGGDCVTCHTTSEHTLWGRYLDTCSTCHTTFNGGPGNTLHDTHNPVGGWSDRNSATSGLTFPYASDPNMWITNWPLNPDCATCHTAFDDDSSGAGCGACHSFPGKGDLHIFHSGKKAGEMDIDCTVCHFQS